MNVLYRVNVKRVKKEETDKNDERGQPMKKTLVTCQLTGNG